MLGYTNMAERYPLEKPRALTAAGYSTTVIGKNHNRRAFDAVALAHGADFRCAQFGAHRTRRTPRHPADVSSGRRSAVTF
jgi:arylsulfatase A-like enzyme